VLAAQDRVRAALEAAPMRFVVTQWQPALDRARAALAGFVGADAARLVFVPNATNGVATALASARLAAGDEIVLTDHTYRACRNQLDRLAAARGVGLVVVALPLPFRAEAFAPAIEAALTARTRLCLLDHVTSATALRLPIERLVPRLRARGVDVLIDGAHAPGQLELDVAAIGATWYVGNCHKWLCAPKGSGFIVVDDPRELAPLVTSHGASPSYGPANRLHAELDWAGTHDPSPHLVVPDALAVIAALGGGWPAVRAGNHALVLALRDRLIDGLRGPGERGPAHLADDDDLGAMATVAVALPPGLAPIALERALLDDGWEVPIVDWPGQPLVRVSAQLYNHAAEADALAAELHRRGVRLAA
jgi:isopenicillin-N epimerase